MEPPETGENRKTCPTCAEAIRAAAIRCRHGNADLAGRREGTVRAVLLAAGLGIAASLVLPLLGVASATVRAPRPVPAVHHRCPGDAADRDLGALLPPGHPPVRGLRRALPPWHPPIGEDGEDPPVDYPQDGARTL